MKARVTVCAVLATSWLATGCSDGSDSDGQSASQTTTTERTTTTVGVVEIALAGRSTATFGGDTPCGEGGTEIVTDGTGSGDELGGFTYHATHCSLIERREISDGLITFTLADGDTFAATYTGTFASLDDLAAIPYALEGTITDGSGRFSGASGSLTSEGVANALEGTTEDTMTGTVRVRRPA